MQERTALPAGGAPPSTVGSVPELLPKQFGKYTLLSKLSVGGMAEIFLALHRSSFGFEKLVVIKRILPWMNQERTLVDMLLHEARVAATLSHPNIVQTFDAGQVDSAYFIAMEHVHGEDVGSIVREAAKRDPGGIPLEHALGILLGICAGLAYIHDKRDLDGTSLGIVHRDISPRNVVVSYTGDVKIVDFGIARSELGDAGDQKENVLRGKFSYMAPEHATGDRIDHRADIFAAGVILFEMTTGTRLFKGGSQVQTLLQIRDSEYPRPSAIKPGYPKGLERIVLRALEKRREDRYQSAREMQAALEELIRDERIPVSPMGLMAWMESLFQDKLARHREALLGVRQLVDVVAAQQQRWSLEMSGGATASQSSVPPSTSPTILSSLVPTAGKGSYAAFIPAASALALVPGFLYMQHQLSERHAEIMTMYHDAQASRPEPATPVEAKGSLEITTKPEGCTIWVNGDRHPVATPAKLHELPLDRELHIKLTRDGYKPYRTAVKLSDEVRFKEIVADLDRLTATVVLWVDPPANVFVDGKLWKGNRTRIEGLTVGEAHRVVLSAPGHASKTLIVSVEPGEMKTLSVRLPKLGAQAPAEGRAERAP
ncbi:serine/threonine protein kinase [Sorangium sp. So ce1000]|uniref:serine/threonine protein kinase n=1 Tax=Sorangium sp. So ce1000 TaxID=3133325 RepID=UPI003F60088C